MTGVSDAVIEGTRKTRWKRAGWEKVWLAGSRDEDRNPYYFVEGGDGVPPMT
jgi:hypothetical protein